MQGDKPKCYMQSAEDPDTLGFCTVMLSLSQGEEVYVQIIGGKGNNDHVGVSNTFSGHLVNINI